MLPEQVSWLSFVLLAAPSHPFEQWLNAAFVPITVAGRRESFTPFPSSGATQSIYVPHLIQTIDGPKKIPGSSQYGQVRGCRFSSSIKYQLQRPFREAQCKHHCIQVFRLPDHSTCRAFPSIQTVAFCSFRSRLRRRVRDGFQPSSLINLKTIEMRRYRQADSKSSKNCYQKSYWGI
jgi:hypothetical protein